MTTIHIHKSHRDTQTFLCQILCYQLIGAFRGYPKPSIIRKEQLMDKTRSDKVSLNTDADSK